MASIRREVLPIMRKSSASAGFLSSPSSVKPMTLVSGLRRSWLMRPANDSSSALLVLASSRLLASMRA